MLLTFGIVTLMAVSILVYLMLHSEVIKLAVTRARLEISEQPQDPTLYPRWIRFRVLRGFAFIAMASLFVVWLNIGVTVGMKLGIGLIAIFAWAFPTLMRSQDLLDARWDVRRHHEKRQCGYDY